LLGNGDLQSPVCAPEHRPLAARALQDVTRARDGCRLVLAERLPREGGWAELVDGTLVSSHHDPVLRFEGRSWEEVLAARSKNFREQVRRRERRLVRELDLSFRLADDPDRLPTDLEALFRLHGARWGEETTGVFSGPGADFHREFAAVALQRGWLRLWLAEIDGKPVAAWYGLRFGGAEWYYQAGRDPSFDRLSLGFVMLAHTVREACRDGADSYHFLAGAEEYKSRFAAEDPGSESRLLGSGPLARAAKLGISVGFALPPGVRRGMMRVARRGA
jgi:CelD/BcsL family acetyltransferase involved in cellulose biosynthesis